MDTAIDVVTTRMGELNATAATYNATLLGAMNTLANIKMANVAGPKIGNAPDAPELEINLDAIPAYTHVTGKDPAPLGNLSIDDLLRNLDVSDLDLPDAPSMPGLSIPTAPVMSNIAVPARPNVDTNVDVPNAPNFDLPTMEALEQLNIPAFTFPTLPDFSGTPPNADHLDAPDAFVDWQEPEYESELMDELLAWIRQSMQGGTGLPAPIEQALFGRARERDSAETERAVQEAVDTWAARNFTMPPGMLAKQANVIREQGRLKAAELNRDILIEATKWEIEGIRFAVEKGMALEQMLQNLFNNTAQRMFEMARYRLEAQINVFNAKVGLFNARSQAFGHLVTVYKTRLEGALAKLQAYKIAIDGQVALGQINQQRVEVFKAKMQAVQTSADVFATVMKGAQVKAEVVKTQFDAYRADIQAYAEQIGAEKVKFDAYDSQVKGEVAKGNMFEAQARAFAATVQGISAKADVKVKGIQLKIEAARAKVQKYVADVDRFRAELDAGMKETQANLSAFQAQISAWDAGAKANITEAEMHSRYTDMQTRTNIAYTEAQIKQFEANMDKAYRQASVAMEAAKAIGQYSAQLAAGAMSALNVSASVSGSGSQSDSVSNSFSKSTSTNYNYSY